MAQETDDKILVVICTTIWIQENFNGLHPCTRNIGGM